MKVDADDARQNQSRDWGRRLGGTLIAYWLVMFAASHVRLHESVPVFRIRDKVLHFLAYAGLAFLAISYQRLRKGFVGWWDLAAVWLLAAGYGVFDELTQIPVGRTCDPLDWLADVAGAAAGLGLFLAVRSWMPLADQGRAA